MYPRTSARDDESYLRSLRQRGVRLWTEGANLCFQAPTGTLTAQDTEELRARKDHLLMLLEEAELDADPACGCRRTDADIPLTATQRHWWSYLQQHQAGLGQRLAHVATRVRGVLDLRALQQSLDVLVRRHESLRTRFHEAGGAVRQFVDEPSPCRLEVVDLSHQTDAVGKMKQLAEQLLTEAVDLSTERSFVARLFRMHDGDHVLLLAMDHIITDTSSNAILNDELWTTYEQLARGMAPSLPQLPLQFSDYACWQQRTAAAWQRRHGAHWKHKMHGVAPTRLPVDCVPASVSEPRHVIAKFNLGASLSDQLRDLGRREQTLPAFVTLTTYVIAMSQWCGKRDLVIALVSDARFRPELQNMVGFLANVLCIRIRLSMQETFADLLQRVAEEVRDCYRHHDFDRLPDLIPECSTDIPFNWVAAESSSHGRTIYCGLQTEPMSLQIPWSRRFLAVFTDAADGITAHITYQSDVFLASTIQHLGRRLIDLSAACVACPHTPVASLVE